MYLNFRNSTSVNIEKALNITWDTGNFDLFDKIIKEYRIFLMNECNKSYIQANRSISFFCYKRYVKESFNKKRREIKMTVRDVQSIL